MEKIKKEVLKQLSTMEGYTAKADCLETFGIAFRVTGVMTTELERFIENQWKDIEGK